ncbi:MAG: protein kinase domain-containing protein [Gemmatimonadaceae bacterium]
MPDTCPNCGAPLAPDAIFCHRCGRNFTVEMAPRQAATADAPAGEAPLDDTLARLRASLGDRYQVERELGRGGMATVFLARDLKHDREVAIKVLHPDLAASVGAERFEREIRLAAKLQHPNILGLYDSGAANGLLYYVMPFVKGESLRDRLDREHMLPIEDAVAIALQVADALGYAHAQGIVHRDIKPENILMSGGHALVADFGIARAVSQSGDQKLTQTGMSMGTPYYMAPEQAGGETVGPTADLYSLGCMLYEMLAGEPPFTGKNSMQIMARHAMEQVPSIRIVRNTVPEEVEEAIFAALNKVPADRPQTAAAFGDLMGMPPGATAAMRAIRVATGSNRRIPSGTQSWRAVPERAPLWRRPLVLGLVAVVVAAAGFGVWRWRAGANAGARIVNAGADAHRIAVLYFDDLSKDHGLQPQADGLTEGLIRSLGGSPSFTVVSSAGVGEFRGTSVGLDSIARALHAGYLVRGTVDRDGDSLHVAVRLDDAGGFDLKQSSFTLASTNLLAVRDSLSQVVGDFIRQQLGEQLNLQQQRAEASNSDAWLLVQRGQEARRQMEKVAATGDSAGTEQAYHTADSLYAAAAALDPKWPDPETDRGQLAYRRSRLARNPAAVGTWVALGEKYANQALAIAPNDADALELRGTLEYFAWLMNLETDPTKKAALITAAKNDLEKSTSINRAQAGAWAVLSHLYNNYPSTGNTDVLLAAQRAYEADEFQTGVDLVLSRLVFAAYDLGEFSVASQWCGVFHDRFPKDYRATHCQLLMLTANDPSIAPNVPRAWRLADSVAALTPEPQRQLWRMYSDMLVASVIARASKTDPALADSARHVIQRSLPSAQIDPNRDMAVFGAMAYTILGDDADAVRLLKLNFAVNPQRIAGYRGDPGWQFRALERDPAFRQLVGSSN